MADIELVVIESPLEIDLVTVDPGIAVTVVPIEFGGGGGGGTTDHGLLTGLSDDDHPQYHNDTRGDARYYTKTSNDTLLAAKAPTASPTFTGTVAGVTKTHVGLGSVDNTADTAKPVSTAQQTAIDVVKARSTHTGTQSADTLTDGTTNKAFLATERTKLTGIATSATANSADATLLARANHTGTQSADTLTDGTTNKAFLATERTKLTGVATGATANSTDATLLARANHTGTQAESTITNLVSDLAGKAASTHSHAIADLPAGSVFYSTSTTRPTSRTDVMVMFLTGTDPATNAFDNDIWVRTT